MTYHNAVKFIKNAPNITPKDSSASERIIRLCATLGNPQKRMKYVRLAGSNGKTVCARMIISILNKAEIKNGCLSMPIHSEIRENIRINGEPISMNETVSYVEEISAAVAKINEENASTEEPRVFRPTAHEILLCMAILAFNAHGCTVCIIESDHDGEDPSRFLHSPFAAVICGRIPSGEKQEILKIRSYICRGIREIISAPQNQEAYRVISDTCVSANCRLTQPARNKFKITNMNLRGTSFIYKDSEYSLRICGKFQTANALVAIESAEMLSRCGYKISAEAIKNGLSSVTAPCKFEILSISPVIIADSTHTGIAIGAVCDSLADFKKFTGTKVRLCLPEGELIPQYIEALQTRGYSIEKISSLADPTEEERQECSLPVTFSKTVKTTAKDALAELPKDNILLISGPSNFTMKLKYELLAILGF